MAGIRKFTALVLVGAVAAFGVLAWWSMLSAQHSTVHARQRGAEQAAIASALAIRGELIKGSDLPSIVAFAEQAGSLHLGIVDGAGHQIAGSLRAGTPRATATVPDSTLTVAVGIEGDGGSSNAVGRLVTAAAFLVMAASLVLLTVVARDRRHARAEIDRLEIRWITDAAADFVTGLGNRTRLLEDTQALAARGARYGNAFALVLFEIGGEPSEETIRQVAEVLSSEARDADLCYRIAPTRFVTVLPEQDDAGATMAADRIRRSLHGSLGVDVTSGRSAFAPWVPCPAEDLLERAEQDLGVSAVLTGAPADPV